ncbi:bifunctional uridylyltransferase/uridylyl-removing protein GlnD [Paraferrimonas sedimenticola]|uniref:Bifunctional uridylyltransferase/uridylyl-removing enzyme n=1 Tax=Paraferrimonas sedimenticola TaxID=375674 RepID=A0AA37RWU3_9GAMM|nr:bifunctional uridylyltransferase/uridylyl-removing protein GlnD [Paraferrimonas sedimenticola]GLP96724.1 bifunctional uridylyltransferase/uridylyl-removing enzyme [Paraferrimonas sedimenticola]
MADVTELAPLSPETCKAALNDAALKDLDAFKSGAESGLSIVDLVYARSQRIDALLVGLWQQLGLDKAPISLIAVGGYGRGELHPHSDIDLLLLLESELSAEHKQAIGEFVAFLWDCKLDVGHSVRTLPQTIEVALEDITIATNLLESRLLIGSDEHYLHLHDAVRQPDFWPSAEFFLAKRDEQDARHQRASAFDLEPNIKTCPGGLRDVQTVAWVAMRHFDAASLDELVEYGFLRPEELTELTECLHFLWRLRFALHMIAGRAENRLLFDLQRQVAETMGYTDGTTLAVEQMMKRYYRNVRRLIELNQMLLQLFTRAALNQPETEPTKVAPGFVRRGSLLECDDPSLFGQPEQLLKLFWYVAKDSNIKGIYAPTLRALRHHRRHQPVPLVEHPECRKVFMEILRHPRGIAGLSLMHKHNMLSAYLPQWKEIEGQMQFDLFHAYTVDEHTHRLLKNIERFSNPDHQEEFPLGSVLIDQLPKKGLLVLAAIFHDIAKGRGGDHSELGAVDALEFCRQHGLNEHDGRTVSWLVENHLLMSVVAQRRDINDPDVINEFADKVRDAVHLSYLYCLTVADICATNNKLWNNWKGSLLRELYFSTQRVLSRGKEKTMDVRARVREHQGKARRELMRSGFSDKDIDALWARFPADYFIGYQPNQLAWHAESILRHKDDGPLVMLSKHATRGGTELFVYTPDRAKLFATVMAVLDAKNVNVHDASILSSKDGYVVDSFVILEPNGEQVVNLARIQSIRRALEKALSKDSPKLPTARRISRQMKPFRVATQVSFIKSHRQATSLMELIALDKPGLLAKVGEAFYRCQISLQSAKITTIGERAEDFFVLKNAEGTALNDEQQQQLKQTLVELLAQPNN